MTERGRFMASETWECNAIGGGSCAPKCGRVLRGGRGARGYRRAGWWKAIVRSGEPAYWIWGEIGVSRRSRMQTAAVSWFGVEALWCNLKLDVVLRARFNLSLGGVRGEAARQARRWTVPDSRAGGMACECVRGCTRVPLVPLFGGCVTSYSPNRRASPLGPLPAQP